MNNETTEKKAHTKPLPAKNHALDNSLPQLPLEGLVFLLALKKTTTH